MSEQTGRGAMKPGFLKTRRGMALSIVAVIAIIAATGVSWSWLAAAAIAPLLVYILFCGAMFAALIYFIVDRPSKTAQLALQPLPKNIPPGSKLNRYDPNH